MEEVLRWEAIYRELQPHLPLFLISLLKVFYAALPTLKSYKGSIFLDNELCRAPNAVPTSAVERVAQDLDSRRHKEICLKVIASLLQLLLSCSKHTHMMQFHFISHFLCEGKTLLLVLKLFSQDFMSWLTSATDVPFRDVMTWTWDLPGGALLGESATVTSASEFPESRSYSWRNCFSTVGFLRIVQKLTKGHPHRILCLKNLKCQGILKKLILVDHPDMVYYSLKILKSMMPYLGRKFRTAANMRLVSLIYQFLRIDIGDDWLDNQDNLEEDATRPEEEKLGREAEAWQQQNYGHVDRGRPVAVLHGVASGTPGDVVASGVSGGGAGTASVGGSSNPPQEWVITQSSQLRAIREGLRDASSEAMGDASGTQEEPFVADSRFSSIWLPLRRLEWENLSKDIPRQFTENELRHII